MMLCYVLAIGCGPRTALRVEGASRAETARVLERYERFRLEAAGVPPPTVSVRSLLARSEGLSGTAELVIAEDADWNQWPGSTSRLFNNRVAMLFNIDLTSEGPIRWLPERTLLELNAEGNVFRAAASPDSLLEDLVFWAYHQERSVLDGDLAQRLRAAGPLREAYLPASTNDTLLEGLIAFPFEETAENAPFLKGVEPAEYHVVSMRLTLSLEDLDGRRKQLVWTFD